MRKIFLVAIGSVALGGCGARTSISQGVEEDTCHSAPPTCVQAAEDPCGAPAVVSATCNESSHEWLCPAGSRGYARAVETPAVCLPFHSMLSGIESLGGSLVRVPTDDGRCLWIGEGVAFTDGTSQRNGAFTTDPTEPFGTCPATSITKPQPVGTLQGDDQSLLVQIDGGYRL